MRKSKFIKKDNLKQNNSYSQAKNQAEKYSESPTFNPNKDLQPENRVQKNNYELNDEAVIAYNKFIERNIKRKGSATSSKSGRKRTYTIDRKKPYGFRIADMSKDTSNLGN
jgi:hypothetical protein